MKKTASILALTLLFLLLAPAVLCACRRSDPPPFPLSTPFSCTLRLLANGRETTCALGFDGVRCTFTTGDGYVFSVGAEDCSLTTGDLTLPFERSMTPDKGMLFSALSATSNEELLKSERTEENAQPATVYTRVGETENFIYQTDESGRLLRVDGEGAFPFTAFFIYEDV